MKTDTPEKPAWAALHAIRMRAVDLRHELTDFAFKNKGWCERSEPAEGALTCIISLLYSSVEEMRKTHMRHRQAIPFTVRGIGMDVCPCCFVCGATERAVGANHFLNNIAAFVDSKEDGEKIVAMFDGRARLDIREHQPDRIQVKIGACDAHLESLRALSRRTEDGGINADDIAASLHPHPLTQAL